MTGQIQINGELRTVEAETIEALLRAEQIDTAIRGLAVALNGAVVPRRRWPETPVSSGDRIEIVKPFSGG